MRFIVSSRFRRRAKKLREPQASLLRAALRRFAADPHDPLLRTHKLRGDLADYWAFSVRWHGDHTESRRPLAGPDLSRSSDIHQRPLTDIIPA